MKRLFFVLFACAACVHGSHLKAQQIPILTFTQVMTGVNKPVYITNCGDSRLFVLDKTGKILVADSTYAIAATPFLDITSLVQSSGNEQGLLGLAFHPDYKNNGYFYVDYTAGTGSGHTVIERFTRSATDSNQADPASGQILFTQSQPYTNHNGGCLQFGPDGYLYISFGDGGSANDPQAHGQDLNTKLGKILRIDVNNAVSPYYSIPPTNPFVDSTNAQHEIWTYGMRNPWRYSFDRITGDLWIGDVGQSAWEEVDFLPAGDHGGENFGWSCYEGRHVLVPNYNTTCPDSSTVTFSVYEYNHSGGACSITGGYMYRGGQIGSLYGHYLFADYCVGTLKMLKRNYNNTADTAVSLITGTFPITSFGQDRWGELFACSYPIGGTTGSIYKITDNDCKPTAVAYDANDPFCYTAPTTVHAITGQGLTYHWLKNGTAVGNGAPQLLINTPGMYSLIVTNAASCSDTMIIHAFAAPTVSFTPPLTNCNNTTPSITLSATPAGGTFSSVTGTVSGTQFTPALGHNDITYTYTDANGCTVVQADTLFGKICNGVPNLNPYNASLTPNPTVNELQLTVSAHADALQITVYDAAGKSWMSTRMPAGTNLTKLNVSLVPVGAYVLRLSDAHQTSFHQFVKQHE